MVLLFSITVFLSAFLTFLIQPMVARMLLPLFGGSSSVWSACVFVFQALLLLGYSYAYVTPRWWGTHRQARLHLLVLLIPTVTLPIAISSAWIPPEAFDPSLWLIIVLPVLVGLPYFAVTTTAPLLQQWFATTRHQYAQDPYFLYAASNLGSLISLCIYPILFEPIFPLAIHSWLWSAGYLMLVFLITICALLVLRNPDYRPQQAVKISAYETANYYQRVLWLIYAFIPSSLMLSVTTYLTTDIAPIPLLWVSPLVLYLLTFILAFSRLRFISRKSLRNLVPLVVLILALVLLSQATEPVLLLIPLQLLGFFLLALFCHTELADARPSTSHLGEYYFWLSLGGMAGSFFNTQLAPYLFSGLAEYPAMLCACCFALALRKKSHVDQKPYVLLWDLLPAIGIGLLTMGIIFGISTYPVAQRLAEQWLVPETMLAIALAFGIPILCCYVFVDRPIRYGLALGAVFLVSSQYGGVYGDIVYAHRSFYGIHRVTMDNSGQFVQLVHGNTIHGRQKNADEALPTPLTYYHRNGPIGQIFLKSEKSAKPFEKIGIVGLGVGSLASYATPDQQWTFFELDPVVVSIAQDSGYFQFLPKCRAPYEVIVGDARIRLAKYNKGRFDLLVIDAFNSDSLPIHLLTREAVKLYLGKLSDDGLLAFHISNRYLDLAPVLSSIAHDLDCDAMLRNDFGGSEEHWSSDWLVIAKKNNQRFEELRRSGRWSMLQTYEDRYLWTDSYSNLIQVFRLSGPED